jgi:hypothetical protein
VAIAPQDTYSELTKQNAAGSWGAVVERVAFLALLTGALVTVSSARRVPLGLVLMGVLCWAFVPLLRLLIGAVFVSRAPARVVSLPRSLELLLMAHLPWSLWLIALVGLFTFTRLSLSLVAFIPTLLIPAVWTWFILAAFCRMVLGCNPSRARLITFAHQAVTWTIFTLYALMVSGIWARVLARIGQ